MSDLTYSEPLTETRDVDTNEYRIRKLEIARATDSEKIKNLEKSIERLTESVDALTEALTQTRGGWKVFTGLGVFIITLVGIAVSVAEYFRGS